MMDMMNWDWMGYGAALVAVIMIYAVGWWLSQPMVAWGRWVFRLSLLALLAGLTLPAFVINDLVRALALLFPQLREISHEPSASVGMHFLLFLLISALLPFLRLDLKIPVVLAALIGLALATEFLQALIPGRFFDWRDVITNLAGVGLGLVTRLMASWRSASGT